MLKGKKFDAFALRPQDKSSFHDTERPFQTTEWPFRNTERRFLLLKQNIYTA